MYSIPPNLCKRALKINGYGHFIGVILGLLLFNKTTFLSPNPMIQVGPGALLKTEPKLFCKSNLQNFHQVPWSRKLPFA